MAGGSYYYLFWVVWEGVVIITCFGLCGRGLLLLPVLGCVGGGSACRFAGGASISVEGLFFEPIPIGFSFSGG